jgi:hypothetical protein
VIPRTWKRQQGYGKGRAAVVMADLSVCSHNVLGWIDSPYSLLWDSEVWKRSGCGL